MPIYEYICNKCSHKFEVFHRGGEKITVECSKCGSREVQKLFSVFGFSSGGTSVSSTLGDNSCSSCASKNCGSCGK